MANTTTAAEVTITSALALIRARSAEHKRTSDGHITYELMDGRTDIDALRAVRPILKALRTARLVKCFVGQGGTVNYYV